MSDYGEYNGDTMHDMWVDYTYHENIGEFNDWYGGGSGGGHRPHRYRSNYQPSKTISQLINDCKSRISSNKAKIAEIRTEIEFAKKSIENPTVAPEKKVQLQKMLDENFPNRLARYRKSIAKDEAKITSLLMKREEQRTLWTIGVCIVAILFSLFLFWLIYN